MVFFKWCKLKCFFDFEFLLLDVGADEFVCLFWFECDIYASCFDHDEPNSFWFEVGCYVTGEDVRLVSLGDILVDEVDRWDDTLVSFWMIRI